MGRQAELAGKGVTIRAQEGQPRIFVHSTKEGTDARQMSQIGLWRPTSVPVCLCLPDSLSTGTDVVTGLPDVRQSGEANRSLTDPHYGKEESPSRAQPDPSSRPWGGG
jgi:hypothetical protein